MLNLIVSKIHAGNRNKIYISGYFGRDLFKLDGTFSNTYGNSTLNLRWNHLINENYDHGHSYYISIKTLYDKIDI